MITANVMGRPSAVEEAQDRLSMHPGCGCVQCKRDLALVCLVKAQLTLGKELR